MWTVLASLLLVTPASAAAQLREPTPGDTLAALTASWQKIHESGPLDHPAGPTRIACLNDPGRAVRPVDSVGAVALSPEIVRGLERRLRVPGGLDVRDDCEYDGSVGSHGGWWRAGDGSPAVLVSLLDFRSEPESTVLVRFGIQAAGRWGREEACTVRFMASTATWQALDCRVLTLY